MSNKLYNGNNTDYFVEGAKGKGYLKNSGKGLGDSATSSPVKDYNAGTGTHGTTDGWFEGKKSGVGTSFTR